MKKRYVCVECEEEELAKKNPERFKKTLIVIRMVNII